MNNKLYKVLQNYLNKIKNCSKEEWQTSFQLLANIAITLTLISIFVAFKEFKLQENSFKIDINNIAINAIDLTSRQFLNL